jgi:hypothetical protein
MLSQRTLESEREIFVVTNLYIKQMVKVKVQSAPEQATKAQREVEV